MRWSRLLLPSRRSRRRRLDVERDNVLSAALNQHFYEPPTHEAGCPGDGRPPRHIAKTWAFVGTSSIIDLDRIEVGKIRDSSPTRFPCLREVVAGSVKTGPRTKREAVLEARSELKGKRTEDMAGCGPRVSVRVIWTSPTICSSSRISTRNRQPSLPSAATSDTTMPLTSGC